MEKRKVLVLDEKTDLLLTNICDAALKSSGFQILKDINELSNVIREEDINNTMTRD
jgi:hypothetical protein